MGRQSRGRAGRQLRLAASEKRVGCLSIRPDHGAVKRRLRREARPLAGNHHVLQLRSFACQCFSTTSPGLTWGRRQYPLLDKPCPKREARPGSPGRAALDNVHSINAGDHAHRKRYLMSAAAPRMSTTTTSSHMSPAPHIIAPLPYTIAFHSFLQIGTVARRMRATGRRRRKPAPFLWSGRL